MQNIAINLASSLSPSARAAIEGILGRTLNDDEHVSIHSLSPHAAPVGEARRAAAVRLTAALDAMDARALPVSAEEFEAAVDEAMNHIRPRR
jgi:hypothetical protein